MAGTISKDSFLSQQPSRTPHIKWTNEEKEDLRILWPWASKQTLEEYFQRKYVAIKKAATRCGIHRPRWAARVKEKLAARRSAHRNQCSYLRHKHKREIGRQFRTICTKLGIRSIETWKGPHLG